jgi:hypothetical protein
MYWAPSICANLARALRATHRVLAPMGVEHTDATAVMSRPFSTPSPRSAQGVTVTESSASRAVFTAAWFLVLMGLGLAIAGSWLVFLGGPWVYALGGITWAATGLLLLRGHAAIWAGRVH